MNPDITPFEDADPGGQFDILAERGEGAALRVSQAFEEAGASISDALGSAARTGELGFSRMAESILQDLARIALEMAVLEPLNAATSQFGEQAASFFSDIIGQRQAGGPVMAGAPYLVGEQGPEVFIPNGSGSIAPSGPSQIINVSIQTSGEPVSAIQRSERQIAAAIARAAASGGRML